MHVPVDHSRHQRRGAEIDHTRPLRHLHRLAHLDDAVAADEDDLAGSHGSGVRVEDPGRANGDDLTWVGEVRRILPATVLRTDHCTEQDAYNKYDPRRLSAHEHLRLHSRGIIPPALYFLRPHTHETRTENVPDRDRIRV
jgi:hypothetical protein